MHQHFRAKLKRVGDNYIKSSATFIIVFLPIIVVALLVGCNMTTQLTNAPVSQSTTEIPSNATTPDRYPLPTYSSYFPPSNIPGYTLYIPSDTSKLRLEFEYSNTWIFSEHIDEAGIQSIFLGDARFLSLATPTPPDYHPTPNDYGSIYIWIIPTKPGDTVESEVEMQKQIYRDSWWAEFLKDYKVAIDGFGARVIEHNTQIPESSTSLMFERRIYFFAENEIYEIIFEIANKDRGNEFEQQYEYFFKSLKVIR
jgi:hypothetical protein